MSNVGALRILIVDDDSTLQKLLEGRFKRKGHDVAIATTGEEALKIYKDFKPEVMLCDIRMPGMDGFEVLSKISIPAVLMTGHGDKESAIKAVSAGAFAFFEKPFDLDAVEVALHRAAERFHLLREREVLLKRLDRMVRLQDRELESFRTQDASKLLGLSPAIQQVQQVLVRMARKPSASLLILGETGTGKEVVAKELHRLTFEDSAKVPFLALNCATLPPELFESELFGHEKGSFSGAHQQRVGLAEAVREGTLFLDEIGELEPRHQAKLLRFLQERSFRRVGSNHELSFKGRIVSATHRNLQALAEGGQFREDLFYRLNIVSVELPPLKERGRDIELIAQALCERHGLQGIRHPADLLSYPWPGNIRELQNWIERASILGLHDEAGYVTAAVNKKTEAGSTTSTLNDTPANFEASSDIKEKRQLLLDHYDALWIREALDRNKGQINKAAEELGLDRKNLARRIKELNLQAEDKKEAA